MIISTADAAVKRVRWIERAGRKILFIDFSHLRTEHEMLEVQREGASIEVYHPGALVFIDATNAFTTARFMKKVKAHGKSFRAKAKMKTAIIGITGLKIVFFNSYLRFTREDMKAFRTKEEAMKWLVSFPENKRRNSR